MDSVKHLYSLFLLLSFLCADFEEIGTVDFVEGEVNIKPSRENTLPNAPIAGRVLYEGDFIQTSSHGRLGFTFKNNVGSIVMDSSTKLRINRQDCVLELEYGSIFTGLSQWNNQGCKLFTKYSEVHFNEGEVWIQSTIKDQVFSIGKQFQIRNTVTGTTESVSNGDMVTSDDIGFSMVEPIKPNLLPDRLFHRLESNRNIVEEAEPFTLMNVFTELPSITDENKESPRNFNFTLEAGAASISGDQYTKASLIPVYSGTQLRLGYNLAGFIGLSDTAKNLNSFSSLSRILAPLDFKFNSINNQFNLKLGHIRNLTFGHGILLKNYTNTVSYPLQQDAGIIVDYISDAGNLTSQLFSSSISELVRGGGMIGMYGAGKINPLIPLRLGFGFVKDLNQFSGLADSTWKKGTPRKKTVSGFQLDFTYEISSDLRKDTYLFGEFSALSYGQNLRYIRSEATAEYSLDQGYERSFSFGFLGPGVWWKLGHHRNLKIAFAFSSSLHTIPFFNEAYSLERIHYVPSNELDLLEQNEPYFSDTLWSKMILKNVTGTDSTSYYLTKDVHSLLDPTVNAHNKMGYSFEYNHQFRKFYHYSIEYTMLKETGGIETPQTYSTLGLDLGINDGWIKGISELGIYLKQYFTTQLLKSSEFSENTIVGAHIGIKLRQNLSVRIYRHDVYFDNNQDGTTDRNITQGLSLVAAF